MDPNASFQLCLPLTTGQPQGPSPRDFCRRNVCVTYSATIQILSFLHQMKEMLSILSVWCEGGNCKTMAVLVLSCSEQPPVRIPTPGGISLLPPPPPIYAPSQAQTQTGTLTAPSPCRGTSTPGISPLSIPRPAELPSTGARLGGDPGRGPGHHFPFVTMPGTQYRKCTQLRKDANGLKYPIRFPLQGTSFLR